MRRDLVVIGASAGGVEALKTLVSSLPAKFDAAVLIVLHVPAHGHSMLPKILGRYGQMPAAHASGIDDLMPGRILVAPPDHHLVVHDGQVELTRGPRENGHRPSVDVLFRSAAGSAGARVIAVILSGVLDDGTAGAIAVRQRGGVVVAQDPADALFRGMPENVLRHSGADHIAAAAQVGPLLVRLTEEEIGKHQTAPSDLMAAEIAMARMEGSVMNDPERPGRPSGFACPDCGGTLFTIDEAHFSRFRCRVGHAWSPDSLLGEQDDQFEDALWRALRTLEEKGALATVLGMHAAEHHDELMIQRYREQAAQATDTANVIRGLLEAPPAQSAS